MGIFSRRNSKPSARARCRKCGHEQEVEKGVLSVFCKRCGERIIAPGSAIESRPVIEPVAPPVDDDNGKVDVDCPSCGQRNRVFPDAVSIFCRKCNGKISMQKDAPPIKGLEPKNNGGKVRKVTCYTCNNPQNVPESALSVFCSNCGNRIDLKDVEINKDYHEKIMTRGNLTVSKNVRVVAELNVMSARINGEVQGNVFAEDKLTIGSSGRVSGNIIAKRLEIEQGAYYSGNIRLNADKRGNGEDKP